MHYPFSCKRPAQVFFWVFGYVGVAASQALISTLTFLIVIYSWTPNKFEGKVELRMHVVMLAAATAITLLPLSTKTYNPAWGFCWPVKTPISCFPLSPVYIDSVECVRGRPSIAFVVGRLTGGLLVLVAVYCSVAMYAIYRDVRNV